MINSDTRYVAIDTETTGLGILDYPFMVSMCDEFGNTELIEWDVDPHERKPFVLDKDVERIVEACKGKELVFFNQSFDIQKLEMVGINLDWEGNTYDTGILLHIINSQVKSLYKGLKPLADFYLGIDNEDEELLKNVVIKARRKAKKLEWNYADSVKADYWLPKTLYDYYREQENQEGIELTEGWDTLAATYANFDTERTMGLFLLCQSIMEDWDQDDLRRNIVKRERELATVLHRIKQRGMNFFPRKARANVSKYRDILDENLEVIRDIAGEDFNIESSAQLQELLFDKWRFEPLKETKKSTKEEPIYCTDKDTRKALLSLVEDYQDESKEKQFLQAWDNYKTTVTFIKYLKGYQDAEVNGVLYPSLNQAGTSTTRMSSKDPNGQNVMKGERDKEGNVVVEGLRDVFGPSEGRRWFCLDYSQLQLRVFAWLTKEKSMIKAFEDGYDFHSFIASKVFDKGPKALTKIERRVGKNVNFGFVFGASPKKIEDTSGIDGLWNTLLEMFPSAHKFMEQTKKEVKNNKYVETAFGYRLNVDQVHKGVNYKVQGTEGCLVKEAMIRCERYLQSKQSSSFDGKLIFQVHDELIFDFPKGHKGEKTIVRTLKHLMESPSKEIGLTTPVDIEFTDTDWSDVKDYE
jgi:DNA polymerase I-like protein with 3'-5' exonuclease and polymerase domains